MDNDLKERIEELSDYALAKMVRHDYEDYREDALNIAREEIKKRKLDISKYAFRDEDSSEKYAGFGSRLLAILIDGVVLQAAYTLFGLMMGIPIGFILLASFIGFWEIGIFRAFNIICIIASWLYFALLESSSIRGTLGKRIMNIAVTDMNGNKISILRASARYWSKILSIISFFIGFIMPEFTEKKQALHDIIAGTLVVKINYKK